MWGGRFPFLSHDKLDPNVYPSPAKQAALPGRRCRGEVRGRAGAPCPCALSTNTCWGLHASSLPKFPLWASEPPHASAKPLLKIVQDRLRGFFPPSRAELLVLHRWLNDLTAKCISNTFQAFHTEMNRCKSRIFASSTDYPFVSR